MIHTTDNGFEDITIRGPDNFVTFIILSSSFRRKLKRMKNHKEGVFSDTTTIINQGASKYVLERPTTNMFVYYAYMLLKDLSYQLVSTSDNKYTTNYRNY